MISPVAAVYDRRPSTPLRHPELVEGSVQPVFAQASAVIDRRYSRMLFLSSVFALAACSSAATPEKMTRIHPAMKMDQVEAILGRPARIDHAETTGLQGDLYHYPAPNGEGRVLFLNNAVFKAEFVPGAKS